MNLYEAMYARHSVRKYRKEAVEDSVIEGIFRFLDETEPLFPEIRIRIQVFPERGKKIRFSGFSNVSAPHYLAVFTEQKEKSEMNAGYVMQQIALYLTSQGVGTCYQGMAGVPRNSQQEGGLSCVMVMAFGYPKGRGKNQEYRRLPMEELCVFKGQPKTHVREMLEAARLAPSSFNGQPWRFAVYENRFHVFSKKASGFRRKRNPHSEFNFGIMLAHVMVAAEELWVDVDLIKLDNITHIALPNNQYVLSVILR